MGAESQHLHYYNSQHDRGVPASFDRLDSNGDGVIDRQVVYPLASADLPRSPYITPRGLILPPGASDYNYPSTASLSPHRTFPSVVWHCSGTPQCRHFTVWHNRSGSAEGPLAAMARCVHSNPDLNLDRLPSSFSPPARHVRGSSSFLPPPPSPTASS